MKVGIYAGSFDPLTIGHIAVIEQASKLFDTLIVAVGDNPDKKYMFTKDQRIKMTKEALWNFDNCEVTNFNNQYLVDYCKKKAEKVFIVRGIRNVNDYEAERQMRNINFDLEPTIETIFFMPPREVNEVSSSFVKSMIGPEGWGSKLKKYVPNPVLKELLVRNRGYLDYWERVPGNEYYFSKYDEVLKEYNREGYHNILHIAEMLDLFEEYRIYSLEKENSILSHEWRYQLIMAIFFHDIFYIPGNPNNEILSGIFFDRVIPNSTLVNKKEVQKLIESTAINYKGKQTLLTRILHDLDYAILGADWNRFMEYETGIQVEALGEGDLKENNPSWLKYKKHRISFLESVLKKKSIYYEPYFKNRFEMKARENLTKLIKMLKE